MPDIGNRKMNPGLRVAAVLLLGISSYVCIQIAAGADLAERRIFIRLWNCLICGILAVAVPHLLFPDADLYLIQTLNLNRKQLFRHQFRKIAVVLTALGIPAILLVFYGLENLAGNFFDGLALLVESWLFLVGIVGHAFQKFIAIGQRSQEVREGKRGELYQRLVPSGLAPTLMGTVNILLWGVHLVVLGIYISSIFRFDFEWLPGLLLLAWTAFRLSRRVKVYDFHFYCTNAFYTEAFKDPHASDADTDETVVYEALYWVPRPWRAHVWTGLIQLDRRVPLALFMGLGHFALWIFFYFGVSNALITVSLLLLLVIKNGVIYLTVAPSAAPIHFQATLQSALNWAVTRVFINLRWTFLLILSLALIAAIWDNFTLFQAVNWVGLDLLLAFLSAALSTYFHEGRFKSRYV